MNVADHAWVNTRTGEIINKGGDLPPGHYTQLQERGVPLTITQTVNVHFVAQDAFDKAMKRYREADDIFRHYASLPTPEGWDITRWGEKANKYLKVRQERYTETILARNTLDQSRRNLKAAAELVEAEKRIAIEERDALAKMPANTIALATLRVVKLQALVNEMIEEGVFEDRMEYSLDDLRSAYDLTENDANWLHDLIHAASQVG